MEDDLLPTITEEDGDSVRSGSTAKTKSPTGGAETMASADDGQAEEFNNEGKKEKKKKKKAKARESAGGGGGALYTGEDHDMAQQILVDLCTEMKELKNSMQDGQEKTNDAMTSNLDSNHKVMRSLTDQMEMLQGNMKQLDQVIESKATPEQIDDLARLRAVQEMIKSITDDKERTVGVYEAHARRGYEEIERLRHDLSSERKEVAALRAELDVVRGDRQRMMSNGPANMYINAGDGGSLGGESKNSGTSGGPGNKFLSSSFTNGGGRKFGSSGVGGDFDDMTLETKGSYDTATYEMKSLKKRIIHMKKKLTVAQMEAKETEELRAEVEKLRVQCEAEKRASKAKDETITRLTKEIETLKRTKADAVAKTTTTAPSPSPRNTYTPTSHTRIGGSKPVITSKKNKNKWWQQL
ncbi:hypothetical protein ACHAXR_005777 [Thalassiosira sp. AJA248-18]